MDDNVFLEIANWAASAATELPRAAKKIQKHREKVQKEENKEWNRKFGEQQAKLYAEAFSDAIDAFYNDYEPEFYARRFSLYKAWKSKRDTDKTVMGTIDDGDGGWAIDEASFLESNVHGNLTGNMREGGGAEELFNQAFIEGWHGGAKTINDEAAVTWGRHPAPGIPYYRKPGWVTYPDGTTKLHRYAKWSRRAARMYGVPSNSPRGILMKKIANINNTTLAAIDEELFKEHRDNFVSRCREYENELLAPILNPGWLSKLQ